MKEQDLSRIYARSIMELGEESKIDVAAELTQFELAINSSNDLENLLFLDIFTSSEKVSVLQALFGKLNFSTFVQKFLLFLVEEKRINQLPLIYKEVIILDDHKKGFIRASIEGKEKEMSPEDHDKIFNFLKEKLGLTPRLTYSQRKDLTAGYKIIAEDLHLDATIDHQFDMLKQSILGD